jgi:hypothetical protein
MNILGKNLHEAETQADCDRHLLLELHIELPDEDPGERSEVKINGSTPCYLI